MATVVWHNPNCSKSRGVKALLEERGIEAEYRHYLEQPPTVAELEVIANLLGSEDGAELLRPKEAEYSELKLADADRATRLAAVVAHPKLLNRPVFVHDGRAIVARPSERALELL